MVWIKSLTGPVVPLDPGSQAALLGTALGQQLHDIHRQRHGLTGGEQRRERRGQLLDRRRSEHGDVPGLIEQEAIGREIAVSHEDGLLGTGIGTASGAFRPEACRQTKRARLALRFGLRWVFG